MKKNVVASNSNEVIKAALAIKHKNYNHPKDASSDNLGSRYLRSDMPLSGETDRYLGRYTELNKLEERSKPSSGIIDTPKIRCNLINPESSIPCKYRLINPVAVLFKEGIGPSFIDSFLLDPSKKASINFKEVKDPNNRYEFSSYIINPHKSKEKVYSLFISGPYKQGGKSELNSLPGYWVNQGESIDIPMYPTDSDPKYVFTAGFSGCSFVVDKLDDSMLRIYHVEGGKEEKQYSKVIRRKTKGMVKAMQYNDYGFQKEVKEGIINEPIQNEKEEFIENILGFAYLHYNEDLKNWTMHYQSQSNPPSVDSFVKGIKPDQHIITYKAIAKGESKFINHVIELAEPPYLLKSSP